MIEYAMLIALGFLLASIVAVLFAGPFWRRAVRLTRKRLEATMPMTVADIQADKDQLRAEYAVEIRRVEMAYEREKDNAARFLVERNKHRVEINELKERMRALSVRLDEQGSESTVLEQTVRKRIPELEAQLERARQIIAARDGDLARMTGAYENQTEALALAKKTVDRHLAEIDTLREAMDAAGAAKRDGAEGSEALSAENQKLQAELSRLRQEAATYKEIAAAENAALRNEIQSIADQMMTGKVAKPAADTAAKETEAAEASETPADDKTDANASKEKKAPPRKRRTRRRTTAKKPSTSLSDRLKTLTTKEDA